MSDKYPLTLCGPDGAPPRKVDTPWLNATEAMGYLRLPSVAALYKLVRRGLVPVHRVGLRGMLFHRDELEQALLRR